MAEIRSGLADARARMQNNPIADQRMANRDLRPDQAIAADADIGADHAVRANDGTRADLGARADDHAGIDDHPLFKPSFGMD